MRAMEDTVLRKAAFVVGRTCGAARLSANEKFCAAHESHSPTPGAERHGHDVTRIQSGRRYWRCSHLHSQAAAVTCDPACRAGRTNGVQASALEFAPRVRGGGTARQLQERRRRT